MSAKLIILLLIGLVLALGGCNLFIDPSSTGAVNASDIAAFQKIFMSSYAAERGGKAGGARALMPFGAAISSGPERTTVPVGLLTNTSFLSPGPTAFVNYPEPGQTTTFTLTARDATNNVYDITATTTYSAGDARKNYVEEYYVRDIGKNGLGYFDTATPDYLWTFDDPIVVWTGAAWVQDQKARVRQILTFPDGTTRTETIVSQTDFNTGLPRFAAFDVNGSLDFGQFFYPATDSNAAFSSVVVYTVTPGTSSNFWFWQGAQAQTILGIRYYTEFNQGGKSYSYTILFEKTLNTLSTQGVSAPLVWQTVFVGSQFDTIAESVLRQQATYDLDGNGNRILSSGIMTTNMESRVVNITGQKDFFLQQLNSDYVTLSSWDTTTIYTPTGSAAEVLAGDPSKFLYNRSWTGSLNGGQPLAVLTNSLSGAGDLAGLYTSLQNGAVSSPTGTTIPGAIPSTTEDLQFNGTTKGSDLGTSGTFDLTDQGTIEAWVYIKQHTDTGGIVHKGVATDFSDECYSLQFWGNNGQVAFVVDGTGGGSNYDLVTSSINLNTGAWYYLLATWDNRTTTNPKFMKLYINGILRGSTVPTHGGAQLYLPAPSLIIGSQLPNQYSAPYGYFSFNGAINGVVLTKAPMTAQNAIDNYNLYKDLTAGWPHP